MTATTVPPPARTVPRPRPAIWTPELTLELAATLALAAFSAVVAAGFARVFSGWDFLDNLLVLVIAGHGLGFLLRRLGVTGWIAVPALGAVLVWLVGALYYRDTYRLLLPGTDTWTLFRAELDAVGDQFQTAIAPVAFLGGWDVLASLGIVIAVVLADTFAFRAFARAESLVPGGVLFVFVAALGADRLRVPLSVALVVAGVVATSLLRAHHTPRSSFGVGGGRSPTSIVLPGALAMALLVGAGAGALGPRLPGFGAEPIYDATDGDTGSVTEVVSPLVDIRSRLTNRSNTELFVVDADGESYWRSSALPRFDGTTWGLPERALTSAEGPLGEVRPGSVEIRQSIFVAALGGALVPAAADPIAAQGPSDLRWNADSATLVKTGDEIERGDRFEVVSASPRFDAADLDGATSVGPGDPIYLELPNDFPGSVAATARDVTAGSPTPYRAAVALQDWFRAEFDYSLEIQSGHGTNAIEAFLRDRVGYCEQFSGTYAAMMRSIGIPARVAVGFTPGITEDGLSYSVRGRHAHAWPEVWFDGFGWVPFEPTPGRGVPGAEGYTGVPAQQDEGDGSAPDEGGEGSAPPAPTAPTTTLAADAGATSPTTLPPSGAAPAPATPSGGATEDASGVPWRSLAIVLVLLAGALAPALVRRVRRSRPVAPDEEVRRLWQRALDAVREVGVVPAPHLTPLETARVTGEAFPVAARPMEGIAEVLTASTFAPAGSLDLTAPRPQGGTAVSSCVNWTRQIERAATDSMGVGARLRRYFTSWR